MVTVLIKTWHHKPIFVGKVTNARAGTTGLGLAFLGRMPAANSHPALSALLDGRARTPVQTKSSILLRHAGLATTVRRAQPA